MGEKIRILFLIDELQVGGTERQLLVLVDSLPLDRFAPVIGVLRESLYSRTMKTRTPVVNFNWSGLPVIKNLQLIRDIRRYLLTNEIDILQTQFVESEIYGFIAAHLLDVRPALITTRRNLFHWIKDDPLRFRIGKRLARSAKAILANSFCAKDACQSLEMIDQEKIVVIPNAVAAEAFAPPAREIARERCGINADDIVIGVIGNWRHVKGNDVFLKAAAKVASAIPDARFVLVGSGPQEEHLRNFATDCGIADKVIFWGSTEDVQTLISSFDIAVQPSRSESFSNVLVEYMAAGKPIVATRVGDAKHILEDGLCGRLVAPESADEIAAEIIHLHHNQHFASALGERARQRAWDNWSLTKVISSYTSFYEEIYYNT